MARQVERVMLVGTISRNMNVHNTPAESAKGGKPFFGLGSLDHRHWFQILDNSCAFLFRNAKMETPSGARFQVACFPEPRSLRAQEIKVGQ